MTDVLNTYIKQVTRSRLGDIFSYKSRTTKRLIRCVLALTNEVSQSEIICNDALTAEVWFACVAPVIQGYWRSPVAERKKKEVIDAFYLTVINIIFNDVILGSKEFRESEPEARDALTDLAHADLDKRLKVRTNEYVDAMLEFFDRGKEANPLPKELIQALTRNLFDESDSRISNLRDGLAENPMRTDATMVAVAMIAAFANSMGG